MFTTIALPIIGIYTAIIGKVAYNNAETVIRKDRQRRALKDTKRKSEADISAEDITSAE